ncbi:MAG: DUF86 domain-containing protein [Ruminococcaceae bacterium]|nr:DUF86 domain-containing protein [Oscillospiraceae bacterium]
MSGRALSYIKLIIRYCQDVIDISKSFSNSYEFFLKEKSSQYSVSFCIEQIGELAKKLRDDEGYADKYPDIPWNKIAGIRNRIAHGYNTIDLEMVFYVCTKNIPELLEEFNRILKHESSI